MRRDNNAKSEMGATEQILAWWGLPYFQFLEDKSTPRPNISSMAQPDDLVDHTKLSDNEETESEISSTPVPTSSMKRSRYSTAICGSQLQWEC